MQSLELRSFGGSVGVDNKGTISCNNVIEEFFSIYPIGEEYVLSVNDKNIILPKYFQMNIKNLEFFFHTITPTSEGVAYSCGDIDEILKKKYKKIHISYISQILSIKIFENVEYYLGSSPFTSICIKKKEFAPYHCKIIYDGDGLNFIDVAGTLKKEDKNLYTHGVMSISF